MSKSWAIAKSFLVTRLDCDADSHGTNRQGALIK